VHLLSEWAHGVRLGAFPLIALVGFATYGTFLLAALVMIAGRRSPRFRRGAFRLHHRIAFAALFLATFHLLLGVSLYV
jgi:hypothetical protein